MIPQYAYKDEPIVLRSSDLLDSDGIDLFYYYLLYYYYYYSKKSFVQPPRLKKLNKKAKIVIPESSSPNHL